ncbi:MAG TPA: serine/threonine-protein kinase, partial [Gemmatimonadales bacterium]|nr:serine/threonine-protein kinase [Gemmatimonadales bacterium]
MTALPPPNPPDPSAKPPAQDPEAERLDFQRQLGGRYQLQRRLGKGGMGVVYLAWDDRLQRQVALKILPPDIANAYRCQRFLEEAQVAAGLQHEHIVPIYSVEETDTFVFFTMAYIEGETLAARIYREVLLPVGEATRILRDLALAMDYAHARGVVHRDLKPANILLEKGTDRVLVADFGIARVVPAAFLPEPADEGEHTLGTHAYVSPEQALGAPADPPSDIYSLGVLGYVMATGEPLFEGPKEEILWHHIATPPPPLRVFNQAQDVTLQVAVARCLKKNPEERFQTGGELARFLAGAPELRRKPPEPLQAYVERLKLESWMAAFGAGIGILGLLVWGVAVDTRNWNLAAAVSL